MSSDPCEPEDSSEAFAAFIVDDLCDADIVHADDFTRATAIAQRAIDIRKAMNGYWCLWCTVKSRPGPAVRADDEFIAFAMHGVAFRSTISSGSLRSWTRRATSQEVTALRGSRARRAMRSSN